MQLNPRCNTSAQKGWLLYRSSPSKVTPCGATRLACLASQRFPQRVHSPVCHAHLRHDVLRRQGNDLCLARAHHHRGDRGMIIEGGASAELTPQTVVAMHGLGRKGVGPIEGHAQLIPQDQTAPTCGAVPASQDRRTPASRWLGAMNPAACGPDYHRVSAARREGGGRLFPLSGAAGGLFAKAPKRYISRDTYLIII